MNKESFLRLIFDYFLRHWVLSTFILTLASNWFIVLTFYGKKWNLIDQSTGDLTSFAAGTSWILFIATFIFALLKTGADKWNESAKNNGYLVLQKLLQSLNSVSKFKRRRYYEFITKNYNADKSYAFREQTKPEDNIEFIVENMQVSLDEIFGISRDSIGISIIYKLHDSKDWKWLISANASDDLSLGELTKNSSTTANLIINGRASVFYPDKQIAEKKRHYVRGPKDESTKGVGSILCRDISVRTDNKYVQAVLSLNTYGKQFCDANDLNSIHKIENIVLPIFELRLRLELALLFIKESINPQCLNCPC